mgnify:CR=1 FL=1
MFRYNKSPFIKRKSDETGYVKGWRESQLLKSLDNTKNRKFEVKLKTGVVVEIDIHFFESLMRALNLSNYLESGVPASFYDTKGVGIKVETFKPLIAYLRTHHEKSEIKLPAGTLDLLALFISQGSFMYDEILDFEKNNKKVIKDLKQEKKEYRIKALELETQNVLQNKTDSMQEQITKIEDHYGKIIEIANTNKKLEVAKQMEKEIMPKKIERVLDKYGDDVEKARLHELQVKKEINKYNYLTYAFFMGDLDLLVAKVGPKKIRLRTLYDATKKTPPENTLLYIPDYGDKVKIPKF